MSIELSATVSSKGQIVIPVDVRRRLGPTQGSVVRFRISDDGVRLLPATRFIEAELSDSDLSRTPSRPWSLRLRPSGRPRSCAQHTPSPRRCPGGRSPSPYLDKM